MGTPVSSLDSQSCSKVLNPPNDQKKKASNTTQQQPPKKAQDDLLDLFGSFTSNNEDKENAVNTNTNDANPFGDPFSDFGAFENKSNTNSNSNTNTNKSVKIETPKKRKRKKRKRD